MNFRTFHEATVEKPSPSSSAVGFLTENLYWCIDQTQVLPSDFRDIKEIMTSWGNTQSTPIEVAREVNKQLGSPDAPNAHGTVIYILDGTPWHSKKVWEEYIRRHDDESFTQPVIIGKGEDFKDLSRQLYSHMRATGQDWILQEIDDVIKAGAKITASTMFMKPSYAVHNKQAGNAYRRPVVATAILDRYIDWSSAGEIKSGLRRL
jgi:hypothetical protein